MMIYIARNQFTPRTAGTEIHGKQIGIHAYGNVGRIVARYGQRVRNGASMLSILS